MLIIGSRAAKHWFPDFRDPKGDTDYIVPMISKSFYKSSREFEYHSNPVFDHIFKTNKDNQYVDADTLYTIKVSHAGWNIHWDKTMHDIRFFQSKGCKLNTELLELLIDEWNHSPEHYKKRVNLNKKNDEFFDDYVNRKYKHDDLHEIFKFYDRPLHRKIAMWEDCALPCEEKWNELSFDDKIKCALEEIYTVATERFIIGQNMPVCHSKYKAMRHLITSMTKGWFNLFLIVHFDKLIHNDYDDSHWKPKLRELQYEKSNKKKYLRKQLKR